jgi:DNA polymerase delta subunit 1
VQICFLKRNPACQDDEPIVRVEIVRKKATFGCEVGDRPFVRLQFVHTKYGSVALQRFLQDATCDLPLPEHYKGRYGFQYNPLTSYLTVSGQYGFDYVDSVRLKRVVGERRPKESDVGPTFRLVTIDIETPSLGEKFPTPNEVEIACIAIESDWDLKMYFLCVKGQTTDEVDGDPEYCRVFSTEREMLQFFKTLVLKMDPDYLGGYNSNQFDFPFIFRRAEILKIHDFRDGWSRVPTSPITFKDVVVGNKQKGQFERVEWTCPGRIFVDTYCLVQDSRAFKDVRKKSLKNICEHQNKTLKDKIDTKMDLPIKLLHPYFHGTKEQRGEVRKYNEQDVRATRAITRSAMFLETMEAFCKTNQILPRSHLVEGQTYLVGRLWSAFSYERYLPRTEIFDFQTRTAETSLVIKMCKEEMAFFGKSYEGGHVEERPPLFVDGWLGILDFSSLYPSIIISFNLCPTTWIPSLDEALRLGLVKDRDFTVFPNGAIFVKKHIQEGVLPTLCKKTMAERQRYKDLMKTVPAGSTLYNIYNANQEATKVNNNSFYGQSGMQGSSIGIKVLADTVTLTGRDQIKSMKAFVQSEPTIADLKCEVVYIDTDSLFIRYHPHDLTNIKECFDAFDRVNFAVNKTSGLNEKFGLDMKPECVIDRILFTGAKKSYMYRTVALLADGTIKRKLSIKGVSVIKGDSLPYASKAGMELIDMIMNPLGPIDQVAIMRKCHEKLAQLWSGEVEKTDFILSKKLSKPLDEYGADAKDVHVIAGHQLRKANIPVRSGDVIEFYYCHTEGAQKKQMWTKTVAAELAQDFDLDFAKYAETFVSAVTRLLVPIFGEAEFNKLVHPSNFTKKAGFVHTTLTRQLGWSSGPIKSVHDKQRCLPGAKRRKVVDDKAMYTLKDKFGVKKKE